jgi:hypothetical protein
MFTARYQLWTKADAAFPDLSGGLRLVSPGFSSRFSS